MNFVYRSFSSFLLFILLVSFSFAQIPNHGFENWAEEIPNDWLTSNVPGSFEPITKSETSHSGSYAVKGEVLSFLDASLPPWLSTDATYFAISQNYTRMTGYYQFSNNGEDALWAEVVFFDAQLMLVAAGIAEFGETSAAYTQFIVNMDYTLGSGQPATQAIIWFTIFPSTESQTDSLTAGSYFLIDDLEFDMVSNISEGNFGDSPRSYHLTQNYPNPFNPSTKIKYSLPKPENVKIEVYNTIGQKIKTLLNKQMPAGYHEVIFTAENLPSDVYFYRIIAGDFQDVKKMVLLR